MPIDPRKISTPLGAAVGLALTYKLLPKEKRTPLAYGLGGGAGAGAGFLAGSYMRGNPNLTGETSVASLENMGRFYQNDPTSLTAPISTSELNVVRSLGLNTPHIKEGDKVSTEAATMLRTVEPSIAALNVWKARKHFADKSGNIGASKEIDNNIRQLQSRVRGQGPGYGSSMFPGGENQWVRDMLDEYVEEPFDKVMADPKVYIEPQGPMPFLVEGGSSLGGGILGAGGGKLLAQGAPSKILPLLKNPTGLRGLKGAKAGKRLGIGGAVVGGVGGLFAGDEVGKRFMNLIRGQGGREEQPDVAPFFNNE